MSTIRFTKAMQAVTSATESCHEFTFSYEGKRYTVLGGLVAVGMSEQVCLRADVLAIDGIAQKGAPLKVFYIEGLAGRVDIGELHATSSNDYTGPLLNNNGVYACGPIRAQERIEEALRAGKIP